LPDVFVSYNRDDRPVARRFAESFEREGLSVWWDQALNPGEAFDQVTEQALEAARAVVVLWSKTSVSSRWVRAEATQASANGRLVPVMIEACRRPIIFELVHTADLSGWDGNRDDPEWQSLVASVRRIVERGPTDTTASPVSGASSATDAQAAPPARPGASPLPVQRPSTAGDSRLVSRRNVLLYGASAVGLAAAGFAGGAWWNRRHEGAQVAGLAGVATQPTSFQRLTFRRGLIRSARIAPDGETILYGALWDGGLCQVHSTRIDNPESRALELPNANLLAVSSNGDLAIALGPNRDGVFTYGTLARVPIAGGAPRELVEDVKFADWSPDGSNLAIVRGVDGVDRLEYPLGTVRFRPAEGDGTGLGFVRVGPDGRTLAFVHYHEPYSLVGKVCTIDAGGKVSALTDEYVNIHGLAWRGDEIWYSASDDRPLFRAIMAVRPGGAPRVVARMPVNVTLWDVDPDENGRLLIAQTDDRGAMIGRLAGETHDRDLSWLDASSVADLSRDGTRVLFGEYGQGVGAVPVAYLRGTDGSLAVRLGSGRPMALSPDAGSALILEIDEASAGSRSPLQIVPTGAGETTRLSAGGLSDFANARWLPDGRAVLVKAAEPKRPPRLYRWDLPDGEPLAVTPEGVRGWQVSPDGTSVAVTGLGAGIQLHRLDGGPVRAVPQSSGEERLLGWIDDGLLVMRGGDPSAPRGEVYVLDASSGGQRSWGNVLPRDDAGLMHMNTFVVTPDGRSRVVSWHRALSNLYLAAGLA
jgi:Tol biopolymer transport system component